MPIHLTSTEKNYIDEFGATKEVSLEIFLSRLMKLSIDELAELADGVEEAVQAYQKEGQ